MPFVYRSFVHSDAELGIWKITESAAELYSQLKLNADEELFYKSLKPGKREMQWLASRVLLRKMLKNIPFRKK